MHKASHFIFTTHEVQDEVLTFQRTITPGITPSRVDFEVVYHAYDLQLLRHSKLTLT